MNILEYHKQFKLFLDKANSQALPELTSKQIDVILHDAEVRLVKQTYGGNNVYKRGLGEIQKRTDDLHTLIRTIELEGTTGEYNVPSDYMFYLNSSVQVQTPEMNGPVYTTPFLCPLDKLEIIKRDPFNRSSPAYPIAWQANDSINIDLSDGSYITKTLRLTYLKYPVKVSLANGIDSELPEEKQREAIQMAVRIALGVVESQRIEEQNQQLGTVE